MLNSSFCLLLTSCSWFGGGDDTRQEDAIAKAYDQYLYASDISALLQEGLSSEDSSLIIQQQAEKWIKQQVLLKVAEDYVREEDSDIEQQVADYRASLLIYLYEKQLTRQKLDTMVSEEEITAYYESTKQDFFELKSSIIRFQFLKLNHETPKLDSVRYWLKKNKEADREKLNEYCMQFAVKYHLNDTSWFPVTEVMRAVGPVIKKPSQYLNNSQIQEYKDSSSLYLISVLDFKLEDAQAPFEYVKNDIRKIILNKRKLDFIKKLHTMVYDNALQKNDVELMP